MRGGQWIVPSMGGGGGARLAGWLGAGGEALRLGLLSLACSGMGRRWGGGGRVWNGAAAAGGGAAVCQVWLCWSVEKARPAVTGVLCCCCCCRIHLGAGRRHSSSSRRPGGISSRRPGGSSSRRGGGGRGRRRAGGGCEDAAGGGVAGAGLLPEPGPGGCSRRGGRKAESLSPRARVKETGRDVLPPPPPRVGRRPPGYRRRGGGGRPSSGLCVSSPLPSFLLLRLLVKPAVVKPVLVKPCAGRPGPGGRPRGARRGPGHGLDAPPRHRLRSAPQQVSAPSSWFRV